MTPPLTPSVRSANPWPLHTEDYTSNDTLCDDSPVLDLRTLTPTHTRRHLQRLPVWQPPPTTNPQNLQTLTDQLEVRTPIATAIWGKEHECQYESRSPNCFIRKCMVTFSKTPSTPGNPKPSPHSRVVAQTLLHNCSVEWFWFLHKERWLHFERLAMSRNAIKDRRIETIEGVCKTLSHWFCVPNHASQVVWRAKAGCTKSVLSAAGTAREQREPTSHLPQGKGNARWEGPSTATLAPSCT